ncbi:MAG: hypothetical protein LIP08_05750 [Bacteroides sp.]|nr:hypothetical protein [Bacteroides sp.]
MSILLDLHRGDVRFWVVSALRRRTTCGLDLHRGDAQPVGWTCTAETHAVRLYRQPLSL